MFNLSHATQELLPSSGTWSHVPSFYFVKTNQNPRWYTSNYTKQLTHVSQSRPFSSKRIIVHLQKTCLISFKMSFDHFSRFNSSTLSFNIFFPSNPTLSRGPGVRKIHSVCILSHLIFESIYPPPISNWTWHNPVGRIQPVFFWSK